MVDTKPFRGILYSKDKIDDFASVTAPPYDVISPSEQHDLYNRHDYNIIRLILGKEQKGDNVRNNKYTRAADTFNHWLSNGILLQDQVPAIYVYQHEYKLKTGSKKCRIGFIALVKLEPLDHGHIRPHEKTLSQPKKDRFSLAMSTHASFDQIFGIYSDPKNQIQPLLQEQTKAIPEVELIDDENVIHRVWKVTDPSTIEQIRQILRDKTLYIADGHHRYETALRLQKRMKRSSEDYTGAESFNYTPMMLVDMNSEELTVLPVHRVLKNLKKDIISHLIENLKPYFDIGVLPFNTDTEAARRQEFFKLVKRDSQRDHVFGMYSGESQYYVLTLKDEDLLDKILKQKNAENWRKLDVAILHSLIIDYLLHVKTTASQIQAHVKFVKDDDKAIELVNSKKYQLAFFVNPTKADQVKEISSKGELLPQKSTYFHPKPLSGLVMFKFE